MQFFDRWGLDFVKMRCINKKTKSAYMAQVSSFAKIEKYLETVDTAYVQASKERLYEFKQKLITPRSTSSNIKFEKLKNQANALESGAIKTNILLDNETEEKLCKMIEKPAEKVLETMQWVMTGVKKDGTISEDYNEEEPFTRTADNISANQVFELIACYK